MPVSFQRWRGWVGTALVAAAVWLPACTDWDAESGAVRTPGWAPGPGSGDQTTAADGSGYAVWDGGALDASVDASSLDASGDAQTEDAGLSDGAVLTDSAAQTDAGNTDDTAETEPYTFDGKADFVGWPDAPQPDVIAQDAVQPDASVADVAQPDVSQPDANQPDVNQPDVNQPDVNQPDVAQPDANQPDVNQPDVAQPDVAQPDTAQPDAIQPDAAQPDTAQPDAIQPDASSADATQPDAIVPDVVQADVLQPDAIVVDATQPDVLQPDAIVVDATQPDAVVVDVTQPDAIQVDIAQPDASLVDTVVADSLVPDSTGSDAQISLDTSYTPDWIGYPDADFGPDADIYAGAIGSCLQLYLYQQESCGKEQPTADCINSLLPDASLYAQFLFEPLRACETEVCVPQCAGATDNTCFERCVGKMCAAQFFACTANAATGKSDCASTFACSQAYEGKFLTMSAKCYAAATPTAQAQFVSVISCTIQPQTESCVKELAGCYGAGPNGTLSCGQIASCADGCGGNDACVQTCIGNGTPEGIALMDNWWDCLVQVCQPKCNGNEACTEQCGQSECLSPLIQCLAN